MYSFSLSCRRKTIASHFDESWESTDCSEMCDHCRNPHVTEERNVTEQCRVVYKILDHAHDNDIKLTG